VKPPLLDKRTRADVVRQALELAGRIPVGGWPGYTPDWTAPEGPDDPGQRSVELFGRLAELVIERLNGVPERNFLSFLDLAGVERFPGAPAEVPVTFVVSKRSPAGGTVPAGTQIATTQTKTTDARVFETRRDFFATRAQIEKIVALHPAADRFAILPVPPVPATAASLAAAAPVRVLSDAEPALLDVPHILHLASEALFGRKDATDVQLTITTSAGAFPGVVWQRFDKTLKSWVDLPPPGVDHTVPNQVSFTFTALADIGKVELDGVEDFWLAARFDGGFGGSVLPVISAVEGSVLPPSAATAQLDAAFYNADPLDFSKPFYPFGRRPAYGDALYLASGVAFSPENDEVTLGFAINPYTTTLLQPQFAGLPTGGMTIHTTARWQYLRTNGQWTDLATFNHDLAFNSASTPASVTVTRTGASAGEGTFMGSSDGDAFVQITFSVFPHDVALATVNGIESRWLRVLLLSEHPYGSDGVLNTEGATPRFVGPLFIPPRVEGLSLGYVPSPVPVPVTSVKTLNNLEWRDRTGSVSGTLPFVDVASHTHAAIATFGGDPAVYIGFDQPFESLAFVSLFFDLASTTSSLESPLESGEPRVVWEYWSDAGWRLLDVFDDSLDLTTSGAVALVAPVAASAIVLFPQIDAAAKPDAVARWWIRARLSGGHYDYPPPLRGVYLNTVVAENHSTVAELLVGSSNGEPNQTVALVKGPVLAGELWVNEAERPSEDEILELERENEATRDEALDDSTVVSPVDIRDVDGAEPEVWVRWRRVPNLALSGPRSRHYTQDSVAAVIGFGNGTNGHIPVVGRNNLVLRGFQTGGGAGANREAGPLAVKELKTSLPFIERVFNVQGASAGASPWTIPQVEEFGPRFLKHRGRPVTTDDYEWLIRQRFSDVARARCMPVREPGPGGTLRFKAGAVTTLVVPWSTEARPQPGEGLIRKVREFLAQTALANIATDVHVKGPSYVAVDIAAVLAPTAPELATAALRNAQTALEAFLHPLTGGEDQQGYGFGRPVFLSEVQAVLERIEEVDHVVSASFISAPGLDVFAVSEDRLASSGTHQLTSGGS